MRPVCVITFEHRRHSSRWTLFPHNFFIFCLAFAGVGDRQAAKLHSLPISNGSNRQREVDSSPLHWWHVCADLIEHRCSNRTGAQRNVSATGHLNRHTHSLLSGIHTSTTLRVANGPATRATKPSQAYPHILYLIFLLHLLFIAYWLLFLQRLNVGETYWKGTRTGMACVLNLPDGKRKQEPSRVK